MTTPPLAPSRYRVAAAVRTRTGGRWPTRSSPADPAAAPALPVTVIRRPGESLESWLEHVADANGCSTATLMAAIRGGDPASTRFLTLSPSPAAARRIAQLTRTTVDTVTGGALAAVDQVAVDLTGLDHADRHSYRQVAARGWTPAHGTQACPSCLRDHQMWRLVWRLPLVTACLDHQVVLISGCPRCGRPFRDQQHSPLRRVGAATVCGNPTGPDPTRPCRQDLATLRTAAVDATTLYSQYRIHAALVGIDTAVLGQPADPRSYLTDLRHLATLLLHLAGRPGSQHLAGWTSQLQAETDARSGTRGPRWGLRPPEDPALRGAVLAAADRVLTAPDLQQAGARLTPWLELTPTSPEGVLGWLADRTVMTPLLTRLVLTGRSPHRRLSHRLDTTTPTVADLILIPQLLPDHLYQQHLAGLFDCRPDTVRLYATLCLARPLTEVASWSAAAEALGLPARLGAATARAASAGRLDGPDRYLDALHHTAQRLPGRNYRDLEQAIARRQSQSRWFTGWAHRHRSGTRRGSRGHAVTWLWINAAHGHPDTSPAWPGEPTARDRASYRRFADSLTDHQQQALRSALNN